jgi:ribosomal protein S7
MYPKKIILKNLGMKTFLSHKNNKILLKSKLSFSHLTKNVFKRINFLFYKTKKKKNRSLSLIIKMFYKKLEGLLLKKGKKTVSSSILKNAILLSAKKLNVPTYVILCKLYNKLKLSTELKKLKIRRSTHFVTFPMTLKRKLYFISSWLISSAKRLSSKKTLDYKISSEIIKILNKKKSNPLKKKTYFISKVIQFRSNNHFRW